MDDIDKFKEAILTWSDDDLAESLSYLENVVDYLYAQAAYLRGEDFDKIMEEIDKNQSMLSALHDEFVKRF